MIEQAEGVERVADDLCDGPRCYEQQHAILTLNLDNRHKGRWVEDRGQREGQTLIILITLLWPM